MQSLFTPFALNEGGTFENTWDSGLLFCYFVILLFCYFVILLFCYFVILLFCSFVLFLNP